MFISMCVGGLRPPRSNLVLVGFHVALLMPALMASGQEPEIGPPVRIDMAPGTARANETTGSANEMDPLRIVAGWNDYRVDSAIRSAFTLSFDGGKTWSDFLLRPPAPNQASVEGDPFTAFDDRTGTLWAGAISFANNGGLYVARLDPDETEFAPAVMADAGGGIDKGWMAAGRRPDDPDSTRLFIAYNLGVIRSDNMGDTWTNPLSLGFGLGFLPRVGPTGEVYIAYWDVGDGVKLKRSLNGGLSFTTHTIATRMDVWGAQDGSRFPGNFRVPILSYLDVDPNDGTLYSVYFDTTNIVDGNRNVDLYFNKSTDQGTTWTTPVVINGDNDPPGDQFFPWLEVDQQGRIHIVFLDSRNTIQNDNVPNGMFDAYYTYSDDGGDTWHEFRLTPDSWGSDGATFAGDYLGLAEAGGRVYPIYLDTSLGNFDIYTNVIVFSDDVITPPEDVDVFRGVHESGNLNSLLASDDNDLCFEPGLVLNPTEAPITLDFLGTLPNDSPASLDVTIESSANTVGLELTFSFWNFNTNSWDVVGTAAQSLNEDTVRTFSGIPADHVEPGTGEVRTRYEVRVVSFIFLFPYLDCVDHVFWSTAN